MKPNKQEVLKAKTDILKATITQDQNKIGKQWLNTFKHNTDPDDVGTNISKLLFACVAQGELKTSSSLLKNKELTNPSNALTSIDYLSHASRVIIDYKNLSPENLSQFLAYFPNPGAHHVVSRSATHGVIREGEKITELKGFTLGLMGQLPTFVKNAYDFGVNIAMGGENQQNLVGKTISKNGFSGHMYFHHYSPDQLMMLGLEQSAPATSIFDAVLGHGVDAPHIQSESDQFGQGHSLIGASDSFTAAGSLYFSDPVYQAKLLSEANSPPPDKYGAMQVTLTNEHWAKIKKHLIDLQNNLNGNEDALVLRQLLTPPASAVNTSQEIESYIAIDFKTYLKNISPLLETADKTVRDSLIAAQTQLLSSVNNLRKGYNVDSYQQFLNVVKNICEQNSTPQEYKDAILRVQHLFELQRKIDPNLEDTHESALVKQACNELVESIVQLEKNITLIQKVLSPEANPPEEIKGISLNELANQKVILQNILKAITSEIAPKMSPSLEDSLLLQEQLDTSWLNNDSLNMEVLTQYRNTIQEIESILQNSQIDLEQIEKTDMENDFLALDSELDKENIKQLISDLYTYRKNRSEQPEVRGFSFFGLAWTKQQKLAATTTLIDALQDFMSGIKLTNEQYEKLKSHKTCLEDGELKKTVQAHLTNMGIDDLDELMSKLSDKKVTHKDEFDVLDITGEMLATRNVVSSHNVDIEVINSQRFFKAQMNERRNNSDVELFVEPISNKM